MGRPAFAERCCIALGWAAFFQSPASQPVRLADDGLDRRRVYPLQQGEVGAGEVQRRDQAGKSAHRVLALGGDLLDRHPEPGCKVVRRLPAPGDYRHYVGGGWRTNAGANNPDRYMDVEKQEIWKGQSHTLKVSGTGPYEGIVKSITVRSEDWAAGWLWKNPPRVFGHNVC